jgi:hypothetical protein
VSIVCADLALSATSADGGAAGGAAGGVSAQPLDADRSPLSEFRGVPAGVRFTGVITGVSPSLNAWGSSIVALPYTLQPEDMHMLQTNCS